MSTKIPTRVLAGVTVPDTSLVSKAIEYARANNDDFTYNHVIRSWLWGSYIIEHTPSLQNCDIEAHAIAAILHDLGWGTNPSLISSNKRFEVDGAYAARKFLQANASPSEWDFHRLQLVWDSIALHTTLSIAVEKEVEVCATGVGIFADFTGPVGSYGRVLTKEAWDGVVKEYPRGDVKEEVKKIFCGLCETNPETTYDNMVGDWGDAYVKGYSKIGKRGIDFITASVK